MKYRHDFVTNSSSSSYVCVAKINQLDELAEYMKEEYGKFGTRLLAENIKTGAEIKNGEYRRAYYELEFWDKLDLLEDAAHYLAAEFIEWTNDGDTEGEDTFLYNVIPAQYMEEIHNGGEH